ncbi:MAG: DUF6249 domain-containing protein [Candidatus Baltobacteraceae bacterium]
MENADLTAIVAILVIFGMPVAYGISSRWFAHQERMAMIQRGMTPPEPRAGRRTPPGGPAPVPPGYDMDYGEWQANRMLHKGIVVGMIGLAILIGLSFIDGIVGFHGPWLLGGLIPLFIGIAQVIIALLSGAQLGNLRGATAGPPLGRPSTHPGPEMYAPPPQRDVTPAPSGWRPGVMTELERPPTPPDNR